MQSHPHCTGHVWLACIVSRPLPDFISQPIFLHGWEWPGDEGHEAINFPLSLYVAWKMNTPHLLHFRTPRVSHCSCWIIPHTSAILEWPNALRHTVGWTRLWQTWAYMLWSTQPPVVLQETSSANYWRLGGSHLWRWSWWGHSHWPCSTLHSMNMTMLCVNINSCISPIVLEGHIFSVSSVLREVWSIPHFSHSELEAIVSAVVL